MYRIDFHGTANQRLSVPNLDADVHPVATRDYQTN
jgi:hypothetical protein